MTTPFSRTWRKEFIFFSANLPSSQSRRLDFVTCSSLSSSCCSSSCSSSSSSPQNIISCRRYGTLKKALEIEGSRRKSVSATQSRSFNKENGSNNMVWKRPVGRGKKPFWRKVLFASKKARSIILLNVITVIYASDILVVKGAEATMDPAAFSAVRFVMSAIPFLPFVFRARDDIRTRNAGIELGFWLSLAYFIEAIGLLTSEAGRASFISLVTVKFYKFVYITLLLRSF